MPTGTDHLLKNRAVKSEIERYKWIESEKAGHDIGFENAARHWLALHGETWLKEHPSQKRKKATRPKS